MAPNWNEARTDATMPLNTADRLSGNRQEGLREPEGTRRTQPTRRHTAWRTNANPALSAMPGATAESYARPLCSTLWTSGCTRAQTHVCIGFARIATKRVTLHAGPSSGARPCATLLGGPAAIHRQGHPGDARRGIAAEEHRRVADARGGQQGQVGLLLAQQVADARLAVTAVQRGACLDLRRDDGRVRPSGADAVDRDAPRRVRACPARPRAWPGRPP